MKCSVIQKYSAAVFFRTIAKFISLLFCCIIVGYFLMVCVYCIPIPRINEHLKESADILVQEGKYPKIITGYIDTKLDNFTDSLMLLTAAHDNNTPPYISALENSRNIISEKNSYETFIQLYVDGDDQGVMDWDYARYWHGYLILLKPLLYFFNLGEIRYINMFLQIFLFTGAVIMLTIKKGGGYTIPLLMSWLFINPISTFLSLQYTNIILSVFVQIIIFCKMENRYKQEPFLILIHFFLVGISTSYFDLLTYPLVSLGVPLAFYMTVQKNNIIKNSTLIIKYSLVWGTGYGGMWIGKWLLGSMITGQNILKNAIEEALIRSSNSTGQIVFSYYNLIEKVIGASNNIIICLAITFFFLILIWGRHKKLFRLSFNDLFIYLIIGVMPFVWYVILSNHSYIHYWFAYRKLAISLNAFLMFGVISVNSNPSSYDEMKQ